jgi:hypothetical protein
MSIFLVNKNQQFVNYLPIKSIILPASQSINPQCQQSPSQVTYPHFSDIKLHMIFILFAEKSEKYFSNKCHFLVNLNNK